MVAGTALWLFSLCCLLSDNGGKGTLVWLHCPQNLLCIKVASELANSTATLYKKACVSPATAACVLQDPNAPCQAFPCSQHRFPMHVAHIWPYIENARSQMWHMGRLIKKDTVYSSGKDWWSTGEGLTLTFWVTVSAYVTCVFRNSSLCTSGQTKITFL